MHLNDNTKPLLTICIPTFERAEMLDKCLEALFDIHKHNHDFCLIVADNGSSDNTKEIIAKWKTKFRTMEAIFHDTNIGGDRNFYSLYMAVKTEYCWLLGDCDSISLQHFAKIEDDIRKGYDAVVINTLPTMLKMDSKIYTDLNVFLDEQLWHITKLSSFVLTSKALNPALMQRYFDSFFIHVGTFVEYLCQADKFDVYFDKEIQLVYLLDDKAKEKMTRGWRNIPFHVWGKSYSTMILSFPLSVPYELKLKLMKDHERQFHWFSVRELVVNKIYRGRTYIDEYKRNRKYIHKITVASTILSDFVMYMPVEPLFKVVKFLKLHIIYSRTKKCLIRLLRRKMPRGQ